VVWLEHDLYDQLQLLQILDAVARAGAGVRSVELLVVGDVAGRPDFHGLGELTAPELEALWPARVPLTDEVLELGRAGWATLCAPDPRALAAFAARPLAGLPYLGAALLRLLEELPDVASGLSRTERQLLEAVAGGAATPSRRVPRERAARGGALRGRRVGLAAPARARDGRRAARRAAVRRAGAAAAAAG
jgi:CRP-like cAMP-binding protein